MLDIKFVRENPDAIDVAMANRQTSWDREKFFELDAARRAVITEVEELQATRNAESKKIGALMKEGKKDEAEAMHTEVPTPVEAPADMDEAEHPESDGPETDTGDAR